LLKIVIEHDHYWEQQKHISLDLINIIKNQSKILWKFNGQEKNGLPRTQ